MQLLFRQVGTVHHLQTHIIEALQRANAGGTYGNGLSVVSQQTFQGMALDSHIFRVHLMLSDGVALHRLEGSGTHVQRQLLTFYAMGIEGLQDTVGEVQSGSRGCHTALDLRIHRLVGGLVTLLRLTVQIRRDGQLTNGIQYLGKVHTGVVPREVHPLAGAMFPTTGSRQHHLFILHLQFSIQRPFLPFLQVTHQTEPRTLLRGLEHLFVVGRLGGFQEEHLNQRTCLLAEMQTGLDDLGIVEHHESALGQVLGQVEEEVLSHLTMMVDEQFRLVTLCLGEFRNALVGQIVVIFANMYLLRIHYRLQS